MFNEFGVPTGDAERNMLPPGQNKPHQQMLAESGVEMNITWMAAGAIASGVSSFMGARGARENAKQQAAAQHVAAMKAHVHSVKQAAYSDRYKELMIDAKNERIVEEYDFKLTDFQNQQKFNADAASASHVAEQFRYTEQLESAAIERNKMVNELMRAQGAAAAAGGTASQSRERAIAINTLGEFGREQTEFNKSLYSARAAYKQRMGAISGAHANADYTAWTKVAVPPALQMHGAITLPGPTPTKAPSPSGGFFSDVMGGLGAGIKTFGALGGAEGGFWNKPGK